ncbi:MAG: PLP-dependent transferase, partial [Steroidobacteraceae bacterium]
MTDRSSFTTRSVRAGLDSDDVTGAVVPPIHLSSTYSFRGFGDKRPYDYSRSGNPTRDLLGNALADLENGAGGIITGTGMGAITLVGHVLPVGARIVAPHDCYGGTFRLFTAWNKRGELKVDFVRFDDAQALDAALAQKTDLLWIETPSNPLLRITDIAALVQKVKGKGTLVAVDNTFLSPAWQRPLDLGADITLHS